MQLFFLSFLCREDCVFEKRGIEVEADPGSGMSLVCLKSVTRHPLKQVNSPIRCQAHKVRSASRAIENSREMMGMLGDAKRETTLGESFGGGAVCCHKKKATGLGGSRKVVSMLRDSRALAARNSERDGSAALNHIWPQQLVALTLALSHSLTELCSPFLIIQKSISPCCNGWACGLCKLG